MKWLLLIAGGFVAALALVAVIGATLPRNHKASRTMRLNRTPQEIWPVLTDAASKSDVPVDVLESQPPHRLVTRVRESEKMFGGTWTIAITPSPSTSSGQAGCTVTITEDGWVANPIFRFVSRFVMGHHATMDALLKRVAQTLSEQAVLESA